MKHARVRNEYIPTWYTRIPQTQLTQGCPVYILKELSMFWCLPPSYVIVYTRISKEIMQRNRLPVWSRGAGVLRIKYCILVRSPGLKL